MLSASFPTVAMLANPKGNCSSPRFCRRNKCLPTCADRDSALPFDRDSMFFLWLLRSGNTGEDGNTRTGPATWQRSSWQFFLWSDFVTQVPKNPLTDFNSKPQFL